MSETKTTAATRRNSSLVIRGAEPADHEAIGGVVLGAYARFAGQLVPEVFSRYLDDALDLGMHASYGRLLVAATPERVLGFAVFYPDASVPDSGFLAGLHSTKLDKNGAAENTRGWITTFAPGSAKFVTTMIKVHGTMKASVIHESGGPVLRITVDYLFVYVVEPPGDPADWMRIVQQQTGTVDFTRYDESGSSFEPWYDIADSPAGAQCATRDGYIHPDYPSGPPDTVQASGTPVNPYSLATRAPGGDCRPVTGT